MKFVTIFAMFLACVCTQHGTAHSSPVLTINPTADGSLYVCEGCNVVSDDGYVLVAGYIQGAVKFSAASIRGTVTQALLSLNPYGLPLGSYVDIYAYGTSTGPLDASDATAGVLYGTLTLPPGLGFGEDVFFDVTSFVASTDAPYLAFNLRSLDTDVFSSLEFNYGHPSQLLVTMSVPEPATATLMLGGLLLLGGITRRWSGHA